MASSSKRQKNGESSSSYLYDPLANLSVRQGELLDIIADGNNLKVAAQPGSGKSTFITQIAAAFPNKNILVISYNASLVKSTNRQLRRIAQRRWHGGWLLCKTYHGLLTTLSGDVVKDEVSMHTALRTTDFCQAARFSPYTDIDMIIVDEAQDMRAQYLRVVLETALLVASKPFDIQWVLLGDAQQVLYRFFALNKADKRYLLLADKIFTAKITVRTWVSAELDVSFRLTSQMANLINTLVPDCKIKSGKTASRISDWVTLYVADVYRDGPDIVYNIVKKERKEHALHDILVLCRFLNRKSPCVGIVDLLVANGIPVHVERSGALAGTNLASEVQGVDMMRNKVTVRTTFSAKGLEANVVIFLNTEDLVACITNPKFVALSRAKVRLYLIQTCFKIDLTELQWLASKMKQRDLRIVCKRNVPQERKSKTKTADERDDVLSKNALEVSSLFHFLDVQHMHELLEHVESEVLWMPLDDEDDKDDEKQASAQQAAEQTAKTEVLVDEDEDEEEQRHENSVYVSALTWSFDKEETHVNLVGVCGLALQLAVEMWWSGTTPHQISDAHHKIREPDPKFNIMRKLTMDALDTIGAAMSRDHGYHLLSSDERKDVIWKVMPSFAKLAIVIDALHGYRELLHTVSDFQFATLDCVARRFYALCENVETIFASADDSSVLWHANRTGKFMHDNQPLQLAACPAIVNASLSHIVHFSHNLVTSHDDRLMAVTSALVVGDSLHDIGNMQIYVVNVTNASVEQVRLLSESHQEWISDANIDNRALMRRVPCDFLHAAVAFKMLPRTEDKPLNVESNDVSEEHEDEDDAAFLANAHTMIDEILAKKRTKRFCFAQGTRHTNNASDAEEEDSLGDE